MTKPTLLLGISLLMSSLPVAAQTLDQAEIRMPYGELKQLLARADEKPRAVTLKPALLSARLRLTLEDGQPVITASFRCTGFSDEFALAPLIGGDIALESQTPENAAIVIENRTLCLAINTAETRNLQLRLLPIFNDSSFTLTLPPCPSVILETGDLPAGQSIAVRIGEKEIILGSDRIQPLLPTGQSLAIRLLDSEESREATRPPEPSTWAWQHLALVTLSDGELIYQIIARASAENGSGVQASLPLPPDARDVAITGDDMTSWQKTREKDRSSAASITWKTRGILDRQLNICYRMPLRPLDPAWILQAPGGEGTQTRFIIATSPRITYAADGLSPVLSAQSIPSSLAASLNDGTCRMIEAGTHAKLIVTSVPIAATADGVISTAEWSLELEPDGASLLTGNLAIEHKSALGFRFDTPEGMKLLSCTVNGNKVSPADLGEGVLQVSLAATGENSRLQCAFTGNGSALDPVEGTAAFALPQTPLFIHSLAWQISLPSAYQAETHGNLSRVHSAESKSPSRILLHKNLCRNERPEVRVFYQRSDLKH